MSEKEISATFVIVGGGIAGVSCAEFLPFLSPDESVLLISASPLVKTATGIHQLSQMLEEFEVEERPIESLLIDRPNLTVIADKLVKLNAEENTLVSANGRTVRYKKLCLATGGKPKIIDTNNEYVLGIRDTETVQAFREKLVNAKRVVVVGNGGIATELVYEIENCQVVWVIKDSSISSTFFDPGAAEFFLPQLTAEKGKSDGAVKRMKYTVGGSSAKIDENLHGSALGPDWSSGFKMSGDTKDAKVFVEYKCEVKRVMTPKEFEESKIKALESDVNIEEPKVSWPVYVELTNGKTFGCDFIVSATGVIPDTENFLIGNSFDTDDEGAIKVNSQMETSVPNVFAAGDVCSSSWDTAKHWFQMRLWTQARHMGCFVAKCMVGSLKGEEVTSDFCFELFTHVTKFFGYKVVLLGLFNGQKLGKDYDIILRVTKGKEYVKVVMQNGRMQGAILVGETDLEETFENLILNQMDLSRYGEDLLNPDIDIEDYFD